jgi:hypothetical protein
VDEQEQHDLEIQQTILAIFTAGLNRDADIMLDLIMNFDHIHCLAAGLAEYGLTGLLGMSGFDADVALATIQKASLMLAASEE